MLTAMLRRVRIDRHSADRIFFSMVAVILLAATFVLMIGHAGSTATCSKFPGTLQSRLHGSQLCKPGDLSKHLWIPERLIPGDYDIRSSLIRMAPSSKLCESALSSLDQ